MKTLERQFDIVEVFGSDNKPQLKKKLDRLIKQVEKECDLENSKSIRKIKQVLSGSHKFINPFKDQNFISEITPILVKHKIDPFFTDVDLLNEMSEILTELYGND